MRSNSFDIVVLGGLNTDFLIKSENLPSPGQTVSGHQFFSGPGGKGGNQAVAAARLGARVAFIGRVGNDRRGRELIGSLKSEKVDVRAVCLDAKTPTGAAVICVDAKGEKQISAYSGANFAITPGHIQKHSRLLENCKILLVQFEVPMPALVGAAKIVRTAGGKIVLDPAPSHKPQRELMKLIDLIRPNSDEAEALSGIKVHDRSSARKAARKLFSMGVPIVSMQAGEAGDLIMTSEEELFFPRLKVNSVDATGAGDAFAAALAVGLSENLPLDKMGRLANAAAALATTKLGAQTALPTRAQVQKLLSRTR